MDRGDDARALTGGGGDPFHGTGPHVADGEHARDARRESGRGTVAGPGSLDGPPEHWAQELAGVAVESGISGFLLMSDTPTDIARFAEEVVPRIRELVHAARAGN